MTDRQDKNPDRELVEPTLLQDKGQLNRREFGRSSLVAGAAAFALPNILSAESRPDAPGAASATGGEVASATENQWREGTTIAAEYYLEDEHYRNDERYIAQNTWLMADHVNRIPEPGNFFVFKLGLGESAIVVRNEAGEVKAFHNVCRHRGSRLCRHDEDPRPDDNRLSVRQLGQSGSAQVFRCPYHAWLYDLDGNLIDAYDMPDDFDMAANSLVSCHTRVEAGHIFLNFSRADEPPWFGTVSSSRLREFERRYSLSKLKIAVREAYPIRANWKLATENFIECYHCGPAHKNLVTTHNWDHQLTDSQKQRRLEQMIKWIGKEPEAPQEGMGSVMGTRLPYYGELNPRFLTGSLDGKPLAPFLPGVTEWSHDTDGMMMEWCTGNWQVYDDHVVVVRFTPRGPELTDCEILWLVHPDAVEGKHYKAEDLMALWDITIKEDIWVVENNHAGIKSGAYRTGRYSRSEEGPMRFVKWYMNEVVRA